MKDEPSEFDIIQSILQGDREAYRLLVNRYKDFAYTIALKIVDDADLAEDVAQESFIKAFQALDKFQGTAKFSTWLYRIVFNTAINQQRKDKHTQQGMGIEDSAVENALPRSAREPDYLEQEDKARYITIAMSKLAPVDAAILNMFYLKELSLAEISEITNMKNSALKVRLFRARKKMAVVLKQLLSTEVSTL